ncbi:MAG: hypothetical protein KA765_11520 [Thermoflexales bacterium]|nr:hypothetical protein [Thermoflexales bacterium]
MSADLHHGPTLFRGPLFWCLVLALAAIGFPLAALAQAAPTLSGGPFYVATTGNDSNDCLSPATACRSIGAAIGKAAGGCAILIAAGTYYEWLTLDKDLTLFGTDQAPAVIDGGSAGRVMTVPLSVTVNLVNLTLQHGLAAQGAGIYNQGTLLLSDSTVAYNTVLATGGGIWNSGTLIALHSAIVNNSANPGTAGGLWNEGIAALSNSQISENSVSEGYQCVAGIENHGQLTLDHSETSGNRGGSCYASGLRNYATAIVVHSVISGNQTSACCGGSSNATLVNEGDSFMLDNSLVANNQGSGVRNAGAMTITRSLIEHNQANAYGGGSGGIYNIGTLTVDRTLVRANAPDGRYGGASGIFNNGLLHVSNSAVISNVNGTSYPTYAVFNQATLIMTNTTVGGNSDPVWSSDVGIENRGELTTTNVTIAYNPIGLRANYSGTVWLKNTLLANNPKGNCTTSNGGYLISLDYNLDTDTSCNLTSDHDLAYPDALLLPLDDYGGATLVYALAGTSPAIDADDNAACPPVDQRGYPRPQRAACDIGAFERYFGRNYLPIMLNHIFTR